MSVDSVQFTPPVSHRLHSGYSHPLLRRWQCGEVAPLAAADLLYPVFVVEGENQKQVINSLPDQYRWSVDRLSELLDELVASGLRSILLFGVLADDAKKDETASFCTNPKAPVPLAISAIKSRYPSLLIAVDICLCAYTNHGHCGLLHKDVTNGEYRIDNQPSINRIADMARYYAECGAHIVAPSDMMDGRIGAIKSALCSAQLDGKVSVMSYAAKFASCYYGPFRDAAGSGAKFGDRSGYQLPPASRGLALRAVQRDVEEGADMVMVKPGGPYLDIVRDIANMNINRPIAIYQVSGEYAMLHHAATAGAFKLDEAVVESLMSMKRAGATILISYFTPYLLKHVLNSK